MSSQSIIAKLDMIDNGFYENGTVRINLEISDVGLGQESVFYFRANDYSMLEPMGIGNVRVSEIDRFGEFIITAPLAETIEFQFIPLSGNDTICRLELLNIVTGDMEFNQNTADSISYRRNFARGPFIRPDRYGQVYPNPAPNRILNFELQSDASESFLAELVTEAGRSVIKERYVIPDKESNTYTLQLPLNLASGNYFLVITSTYGGRRYLVSYRK